VLTTHDLNFVAAHLPRIVCVRGEVTADGSPTEALTSETLQRTYGAPMRVVHDRGRVVVIDDAPFGPVDPAPRVEPSTWAAALP